MFHTGSCLWLIKKEQANNEPHETVTLSSPDTLQVLLARFPLSLEEYIRINSLRHT